MYQSQSLVDYFLFIHWPTQQGMGIKNVSNNKHLNLLLDNLQHNKIDIQMH